MRIARKQKNKDIVRYKELIQHYKDYKVGKYPPQEEDLSTETIYDIRQYLEDKYIDDLLKQNQALPNIYNIFDAQERRTLKRILKLDNL